MNEEEQRIADEARQLAKSKDFRNLLIKKFADPEVYKADANPITVLMAGSPGAGKTEFSKQFIHKFEELFKIKIVRIDADDLRSLFPQYIGKNSHIVQGACALGVEKLYDAVLKNRQNVVLDGTFANYEKSIDNIDRSLRKGREVDVFYIFQDPALAWDFTKQREYLEGRNIPKDAFIHAFLLSRENVNKAKAHFGKYIRLHLVVKNYVNDIVDYKPDIEGVDQFLDKVYSEGELDEMIL